MVNRKAKWDKMKLAHSYNTLRFSGQAVYRLLRIRG